MTKQSRLLYIIKIIILSCVIIVIIWFVYKNKPSADTLTNPTGSVLGKLSGTGVDFSTNDIKISIGGQVSPVNSDGSFTINNIIRGIYNYSIWDGKNYYFNPNNSEPIIEVDPGENSVLDINNLEIIPDNYGSDVKTNLSPTIKLIYPVVGESNKIDAENSNPISVVIKVLAMDNDGIKEVEFYSENTSLGKTSEQDSEGYYKFATQVKPGFGYSIFAKATDLKGAQTSTETTRLTIIDKSLVNVSLSGYVYDKNYTASKNLLPNPTTVKLTSKTDSTKTYSATTDSAGHFSLTNIPSPGDYTVTLTSSGRQIITQDLTVSGEKTDLEFRV